jgi:hypothetical protein
MTVVMSSFFLPDHYRAADSTQYEAGRYEAAQIQLNELHLKLYPLLRMSNLELTAYRQPDERFVLNHSVSAAQPGSCLALRYLRAYQQAAAVERMMGREDVFAPEDILAHRHPVIEIRLLPEHLALEFILSPQARLDQENFIGKLQNSRNRTGFYELLQKLTTGYRLGFWQGAYLSDMHLTTTHFRRINLLAEWVGTFEPGKDLLRLGIWYPPEDERLHSDNIVNELVQQIRALYTIYQFISWSSDNNYRARPANPTRSGDSDL